MAIKKSVRLSSEMQELCTLLSQSGEPNFSGTINAVASRYNLLIKQALPVLNEGEKLAFCQLYNGHMLHDDLNIELQCFVGCVSDGLVYDTNVTEILKAHDVDIDDFKKRCFEFSMSERLAIIDMTQRYWNASLAK